MRLFLLFSLLLFISHAGSYRPFLSFTASRSALIDIYSQHRVLPLSGLSYHFSEKSCSTDGYVEGFAQDPEKIVWRRLVPESVMGEGRACMSQKICLSDYSKRYYKGPYCCAKVSPLFKKMYLDMHNIIPTVLKEDQEDLFDAETIADKGSVARIYLYMMSQYGLKFPEKVAKKALLWHKNYPVSAWEREKNRKIFQLQGTFNPYIEKL